MKAAFSKSWNRSVQPRKQRKFRFNAPLHTRQKFVRAHLSKELREKYGKRSCSLKTGDKIKVMRGSFKGKTGKVERIDLKKSKIYITGMDAVKKEGTKYLIPFEPTNLMITELNLDDKKRKAILAKSSKSTVQESKKKEEGTAKKAETVEKKVEKKEETVKSAPVKEKAEKPKEGEN